ncbi:MAG: isoprenylcysteine carboxylmethyltransferase family protein [Sphingobacteriales bacterium]|nr:MAG: isoprenylcysteine carboxylmethyltransferase family protein [Sphingobacteriales bacterium]
MVSFLRIFLPVFFLFYFGMTFVVKSLMTAKTIGKNPIVLPNDDSAYGLIGFYFRLTMLLLLGYVLVFAFIPSIYSYFLPISELERDWVKLVGIGLLILSFGWVVIAQYQMRQSWRIGIDTEHKTELITTGLFSVSRNPIFLGMIFSLFGLFLATPNALTALILVMGYVLIQIQIRLEEEFLSNQHGETYRQYKLKVRRLI